jgi:hypothetical protein
VGVTHVASRLADEISPPLLPGVVGTPIDHDYLAAEGIEASLGDWRYLAEHIAEGHDQ